MGNSLYKNTNRKEDEYAKSKKSLEKLSIEYNPLNRIKKDLGLSTLKEEQDLSNLKDSLEVSLLKNKFSERKVVSGIDVLEYCVGNDYTLRPIREYRAELSEKCLKSIEVFVKETGIDLPNYKDNFFILAPRKYFKKDNLDVENVAFNIYYRDGFSTHIKNGDKIVEIYGSDFKSSFFSPLSEVNNVRTTNESFYTLGFLIISTLWFILWFGIAIVSAICDAGIPKGGLITYLVVQIPLMIALVTCYKKEFSDKSYLTNYNNLEEFYKNGTLVIRR